MTMMRQEIPRLLFVVHAANRTGAPIYALRFLTWLKAKGIFHVDVLALEEGELLDAFRHVAGRVYVWQRDWQPGNGLVRAIRKGWLFCRASLPGCRTVEQTLRRTAYDVVYVNSIACAQRIDVDQLPGGTVITHVHEMDSSYELFGKADVIRLLERTQHFAVVSDAAKQSLIKHYPAASSQCEIIPGFVARQVRPVDRAMAKQRLGLSSDCLVVGGAGAGCLRKGIDLFVRVASAVLRQVTNPEMVFLWVGAAKECEAVQWALLDAGKLGIQHQVRFVPSQPDPELLYSAFDVFLMPSREDPFPLVNLEVGVMDVPIIAFDQGGGTPELTGRDPLVTVPYLDIEAMAASVVRFANNPELRQAVGAPLGNKVRTEYGVDQVGARIVSLIKIAGLSGQGKQA